MSLYIGTSGWAYPEWKPGFYPADLPRSRFLEHYTSRLTACEVNATFYRLQREDTFAKWARTTPESFRYAAKAHRRITHARNMAPDDRARAFIKSFLASLEPLGDRLGVVLLQYPPRRLRDDDALAAVIDSLPEGIRYAFEFRHESWAERSVAEQIAERGATVCLADTEGEPPERLPEGPFAYVRLRAERYTEEQRERWLQLLAREAAERDVWAFTKHEGIPTVDPYGGIGLAQWLRSKTS